ncbi:hypothetical protein [Aeromicrobium sp. CTD01-1L150]|uniref:hypothetical protein n=1 Tax=Aeromicrobium sp. CTD01-1L150 TaxID=3341830 RepID=UPI0035BFA285
MADTYYFCLKHKSVEGPEGCKAIDRLGPYGSRQEAERALQTAEERNAAWDNDPAWNDDPPQ